MCDNLTPCKMKIMAVIDSQNPKKIKTNTMNFKDLFKYVNHSVVEEPEFLAII